MDWYPINEIFYSLQGEGFYTGTPSIFIRFSGCNLSCAFCDTDHAAFRRMSVSDLLEAIAPYPARHVVLTGGEPSLFVDDVLLEQLHGAGKYVAMETNGTHPLPHGIDWITLSPKDHVTAQARTVLSVCDELKVVFCGAGTMSSYEHIQARHRFLQPCDTGDDNASRIVEETIEYCKAHPSWRLSLQTHKMLNIR
ncbi:MAG: 7-carboxy-7-deazaguanine synthase QueE [Bacteroides sp.]|nr:7-carboxy-7-deazaguanine synthase QueE [Bacteroides sp.]MCM1447635.1 7-carboxy-7-deazaguanine synthase QueE [Bacteroides sp.]MCM1516337.1 7-carboxy-7-deazaguanine synthase QueE [Paraprevotella sp.]